VLGCADSAANDTFSRGLLKHGQYTRPREFEGLSVPEELLSGDHGLIEQHRFLESVCETLRRRPALLVAVDFSPAEKKVLKKAGLWHQVQQVRVVHDN
jgi:tRNA (guanine37-N1)-methyltransferase